MAILAFQKEVCTLMCPNSVYDLLGAPFVNGGRNYSAGLDCWGLVMQAHYILKGVELPNFDLCAFKFKKVSEKIVQQSMYGKWDKVGGPEKGCLIAIRNHPKYVNHTGICLDDKKFMHTLEKTGVVVEKIDHPLWKNKFHGFYRYAG